VICSNIFLNIQNVVTEEEDLAGPRVEYLVKEDRRGTYVVKEKIEKAPDYLHFCNLTRTAVEVSFPEMAQDVFMNLLGYKGSNMIHLNRCMGVCPPGGQERRDCGPRKVRLVNVKMRMKSFLTGGTPRERLRDLQLEDHLDCHCQRAEGGKTEDRQAGSDCNSDCDEILLSCCLGFSLILAPLAVLARHYRNKLSALQDKKKTQLADQRRQFRQKD